MKLLVWAIDRLDLLSRSEWIGRGWNSYMYPLNPVMRVDVPEFKVYIICNKRLHAIITIH